MAALNQRYDDLSALENDLREMGESLDGVQLEKKMTWAALVERERVASAGEKQDAAQNRIWNN